MLLVDVDFAVSLSLAKIVEDEASYGRLMSMLHARCALAHPIHPLPRPRGCGCCSAGERQAAGRLPPAEQPCRRPSPAALAPAICPLQERGGAARV